MESGVGAPACGPHSAEHARGAAFHPTGVNEHGETTPYSEAL